MWSSSWDRDEDLDSLRQGNNLLFSSFGNDAYSSKIIEEVRLGLEIPRSHSICLDAYNSKIAKNIREFSSKRSGNKVLVVLRNVEKLHELKAQRNLDFIFSFIDKNSPEISNLVVLLLWDSLNIDENFRNICFSGDKNRIKSMLGRNLDNGEEQITGQAIAGRIHRIVSMNTAFVEATMASSHGNVMQTCAAFDASHSNSIWSVIMTVSLMIVIVMILLIVTKYAIQYNHNLGFIKRQKKGEQYDGVCLSTEMYSDTKLHSSPPEGASKPTFAALEPHTPSPPDVKRRSPSERIKQQTIEKVKQQQKQKYDAEQVQQNSGDKKIINRKTKK